MPPIDDLPGELIVPTHSEIQAQYLRDVRIRTPDASTVHGTKEHSDSLVHSDQMIPVYYDAKKIGDYAASKNKAGAALDAELEEAGLKRLPAVGGTGYVKITASTGGGTIFDGDEIKEAKTSFRYKCIKTNLYQDGDFVPVTGIDTGPETNFEAGTVMQWTFPRPGIAPNATVVEQSDGSGLSGGRNVEQDHEALERLKARRANPPAAGNDSDYQDYATKTPGIVIQQAFTWSCIRGAGSTGLAVTLRPGTPGGTRIPNATQLQAVKAWLRGHFPGDDSLYTCTLVASEVDLVFKAEWAPGAANWIDLNPWPKYIAGDLITVDGAVTPTTTTFRLTTATTTVNPQIGQSFAFYDAPNAIFRLKRILSFTTIVANKSWDIVCDPLGSDTSYTPIVGDTPGPWSDSLNDLITPIVAFFDITGPGEQIDPLPDPGARQKRSPRSPAAYPSTITNRIMKPLLELASVNDLQLLSPSLPHVTPVGSPGVFAYLLELGSITVFPSP